MVNEVFPQVVDAEMASWSDESLASGIMSL